MNSSQSHIVALAFLLRIECPVVCSILPALVSGSDFEEYHSWTVGTGEESCLETYCVKHSLCVQMNDKVGMFE